MTMESFGSILHAQKQMASNRRRQMQDDDDDDDDQEDPDADSDDDMRQHFQVRGAALSVVFVQLFVSPEQSLWGHIATGRFTICCDLSPTLCCINCRTPQSRWKKSQSRSKLVPSAWASGGTGGFITAACLLGTVHGLLCSCNKC